MLPDADAQGGILAGRFRFVEPGDGCEYFIPRRQSLERSLAILRQAARWPGTTVTAPRGPVFSWVRADAESHTGAMVALVPTAEDAARLAVPGGLPAEELHCTLLFLGEAGQYSDQDRRRITLVAWDAIEWFGPVVADAFAASLFNPAGPEPCVVLGLGGGELSAAYSAVYGALTNMEALPVPEQRMPWHAHTTLAYTDDLTVVGQAAALTGPVTFDRLRIAFGGYVTDIMLRPEVEPVDLYGAVRDAIVGELVAAELRDLGFESPVESGPVAAGLVVYAQDTDRVLMLQRAVTDDDPAAGFWEFPGGNVNLGEKPLDAAMREWSEETGCAVPDGEIVGGWVTPDGVYAGFVLTVPAEDAVPVFGDRDKATNPDDPDGDQIEALAWSDPEQLVNNPAVRAELAATLPLMLDALPPQDGDGPLDEDSLALLYGMHQFETSQVDPPARKFNPNQPRNPKGAAGGGRFKSLAHRVADALKQWQASGGKGDPFDGFEREQLRKVAVARGIKLKRGESRDNIAKALLNDLRKADAPHVGKSDNEAKFQATKARQERIDAARKVADVSATFQELVNNGADKQTLRDRLDVMEANGGDPELIGKLRAKLKTRATPKTAAKLAQAEAAKRNLKQIGVPDQVVKYDRQEHEAVVGDTVEAGGPVVVVRPGHRFDDPETGEDILLDRALVTAHQEVPDSTTFHSSLAGVEDLAAAVRGDRIKEQRSLAGGIVGDTRLRVYEDGTQVVFKRGRNFNGFDAKHQADAEQASSLVARALGLNAPRIYRDKENEVHMDFVDNASVANEVTRDRRKLLQASDEGQLIGLLDLLILNNDRHDGNWMVTDDGQHPVPIDHGLAFRVSRFEPDWDGDGLREVAEDPTRPSGSGANEFNFGALVGGDFQFLDNEFTPQDIAEIRARLMERRADFERIGRSQWHDFAIARLDAIAPYAKGTRSLLPKAVE